MASGKTKANSERVTGDVIHCGDVLDGSGANSAGVLVGRGKLLRIRVTATTYIAFGDAAIAAVSVTTPKGLELFTAGTYLVVSSDEYIRSSAALARLEVL